VALVVIIHDTSRQLFVYAAVTENNILKAGALEYEEAPFIVIFLPNTAISKVVIGQKQTRAGQIFRLC
jgi:hypothetical protein